VGASLLGARAGAGRTENRQRGRQQEPEEGSA